MSEVVPIRFLNRFAFPAPMEREFQEQYYTTYRRSLRVVCVFVASIYLFLLVRGERQGIPVTDLAYDFVPCVAFSVLFGLSYLRGFQRIWQPCFALLVAAILPLVLRDHALTIEHNLALPTQTAKMDAFFATGLFTLMLLVAIIRIQLFWAVLIQVFFFALCVHDSMVYLRATLPMALGISQFLLAIQIMLTFNLAIQERLQRAAFEANHALAQERAEERRRRERSETMLHVLGQAIGGIVHDLGNPLTSVQTGAKTLQSFVTRETPDAALERELLDIITDGAQMLDYLRLSLLEQTRVLEGKDVPVVHQNVLLRRLIEAGAHYQTPKLTHGRRIRLDGADLEVCVDAMRLTTVFMNLIGNALKYSDGDILVCWRVVEDRVLCAVEDQGRASCGIRQDQAEQLFVAFGRLDQHAGLDGTGLGLVSARKIAEAHGGEIFIEGFRDGTPASPRFTTARVPAPFLLEPDFRTAFVVACPLQPDPHLEYHKGQTVL